MFTGALTQAFLILGFALMGATFGAAVAPIIAVASWAASDGSPVLVGVYLLVMAVLTLIALIVAPETKDVQYEDNTGLRRSRLSRRRGRRSRGAARSRRG